MLGKGLFGQEQFLVENELQKQQNYLAFAHVMNQMAGQQQMAM